MDNLSLASSEPIVHAVELYTERLLVQGNISGPFKRISDLMNRKEPGFIVVNDASIVPLGLPATPRKLDTPVLVHRSSVHLVALVASQQSQHGQQGQAESPGSTSAARESYVQKDQKACYALTDTFIIHGYAHLLQGTGLDRLVEVGDTFIPLTHATLYLVSLPNSPWQRELVIVNKERLHVLYAMEHAGENKQ